MAAAKHIMAWSLTGLTVGALDPSGACRGTTNHAFFFPPPRWVSDGEQHHGSLPWKILNALCLAREWPRQEAASTHSRAIRVYEISRTSNQSQYELSHQFFEPNANPFHLGFTVFDLPDELILSVLSYVSPEPRLAGHRARFRAQYNMEISGNHRRRVQFLRPLSRTCRAMRLRLMPWIWERLEASPRRNWSSGEDFDRRLSNVANVLHKDAFLATSVK